MILNEILLSLLLQHSYAGQTVLSVQTMPECGTDSATPTCTLNPVCEPALSPFCQPPRWSTFYGAWVRVETKEHAAERLTPVTGALANVASRLLCIDSHGQNIEGCEAIKWGYDTYAKRNRGTLRELAFAGLTAVVMESSGREDVEMGRGRHKKPIDGGFGRGPSNEGCMVQVLPSEAWRYSPWLGDDERAAAARGLPGAREVAIQKLIGSDPTALEHCMEVGLRMLAISREFCGRNPAPAYNASDTESRRAYWWAFGMYSLYGVGPHGGCYADNQGKTNARTRLLQKLLATAPSITFDEVKDAT